MRQIQKVMNSRREEETTADSPEAGTVGGEGGSSLGSEELLAVLQTDVRIGSRSRWHRAPSS